MSDGDAPKAGPLVLGLTREDLSNLSLHELEERISLLEGEIARCRSAMSFKQGARSDAESVFKS